MRKIILASIFLFPLCGFAIPKFTYEFSHDRSQQILGYSTGNLNRDVNRTQTNVNIADDTFLDNYNYSLGLTYDLPDYSSLVVRDRFGNEETLADRRGEAAEYNLNFSFGYGQGPHAIDFGGSTYLNDVAFKNQTLTLGYKYSLYNSTSVLGIKITTIKQTRPEDYFTQLGTFAVIQRPTEVSGKEYGLSLDQVVTARIKTSFEYSYIEETQERPSQNKFLGNIGAALTETIFLKGSAGYYAEDSTAAPKNERGIFSALSLGTELIYEYEFDHLFSIGYDLVMEDEDIAATGAITRTAFDQYGFGMKSLWTDRMATNFRLRYAESNINTNEVYFVGSLEWSL